MAALAERFMALFAGLQRGYGTYNNIDNTRDDGKRTGKAVTIRDQVTRDLWQAHLDGKSGLGIIPIRDDSTCVFGAVDVDVYDGLDMAQIAADLKRLGLPLIPCRSKSGGVHLYLFTKEPVPAADMQGTLQAVAALLGHGGAEIFPKQTKMTPDSNDLGSWINVPYFDHAHTTRYAVHADGDAVPAEQFLDIAEAAKVSLDELDRTLRDKPASSVGKPHQRKKASALPTEIGEGQRDITLASAAGRLRRAGFGTSEILAALRKTNQERCKPPLDDADVQRIARSIGRKAPTPGNEDVGLAHELADAITATESFARDKGGLLYHWEGGCYRPTGKRVVEVQVKRLCRAWQKTKSWSPELASRVEQWIAVDAPELWECPPLDTVNCRNGLVDIATRNLRPHSPDHLSAVQIAASFDPTATCPHIDRFIHDVFPEDAQHLTFEIAAWLILPNTNIQKAVLLLGEGSNGKSAWLNFLLLSFLGRENVSAVSLHRLESDKFALARLVGKLANICADLPTTALTGTSMFKALTGNDVVSAERKFEASFEFRPFARLLFSANSAPRSDDATHGFFRRWLVVPFSKSFDESDPKTIPPEVLRARLSQPEELSGLLNKALGALPAIRQGRFTESTSTRTALEEFRATTDPLAVWLDHNTVQVASAMVPKDTLRRAYAQVCQDKGRPILPENQFTAALKRLRPRVTTAQRRVDGKPTRVFIGLGFVTHAPEPGGGLF